MRTGCCRRVAGAGCRIELIRHLILLPVIDPLLVTDAVTCIGLQPGIDPAFENIDIRHTLSLQYLPCLCRRRLIITDGDENSIGGFKLQFPGLCLYLVQWYMNRAPEVELVVVTLFAYIQGNDLDF